MGGGGFPERVARADLGAQDAALQGVEEAPGDRGDLLRGVREVGEVGPRHPGRLRGEGADVERADVAGGLAVAHEVPVDREGGDGVGEAVAADPVVDAAILSESSPDGFERFFAELSQGRRRHRRQRELAQPSECGNRPIRIPTGLGKAPSATWRDGAFWLNC